MTAAPLAPGFAIAVAAACLGAVALGVALRLEDPMSTRVIPAEDPFTHMALLREHLRDGSLEPLNVPGTLYPPGLHAFLAAFAAFTGVDLQALFLFGPVLFGAVGLAGVALLAWRLGGPVAALLATLGLAVAPEAVFRTAMMSPTAMDLSVLPFLLYALVRLVQGELPWAGVAAPLAAFLVIAHPWALGIVAAAGAVYVLLGLAAAPREGEPPLSTAGVAAATAILGVAAALSASGCGGACGPGYRAVLEGRMAALSVALAPAVLVAALAVAATLAVAARRWPHLRRGRPRRRPPRPWTQPTVRALSSLLLLAALAAATSAAARRGFPDLVDLPRMVGWPLLLLGAAGFVALPWQDGAAGRLGAAWCAVTFPLVAFNPFHSEFLPHRMAVYFALGLALLAGAAGAGLARAAAQVWTRRGTRLAGPPRGTRLTAGAAASLAAFAVAVPLAGAVTVATPAPYPGWYRLYGECEYAALEELAAAAEADPALVVIAGTWQAKLVVAALAGNASRIWYKPEFFEPGAERDGTVRWLQGDGHAVVALVDPRLAREHPGSDTSFLDSEPWHREASTDCRAEGGGLVETFRAGGGT